MSGQVVESTPANRNTNGDDEWPEARAPLCHCDRPAVKSMGQKQNSFFTELEYYWSCKDQFIDGDCGFFRIFNNKGHCYDLVTVTIPHQRSRDYNGQVLVDPETGKVKLDSFGYCSVHSKYVRCLTIPVDKEDVDCYWVSPPGAERLRPRVEVFFKIWNQSQYDSDCVKMFYCPAVISDQCPHVYFASKRKLSGGDMIHVHRGHADMTL